ncbi:MAG: alkaline phosphatase [bacterium]|nr:alkaline phosphatase [bacterium]
MLKLYKFPIGFTWFIGYLKYRKIFVSLLIGIIIVSVTYSSSFSVKTEPIAQAKNIILLIGDGMGIGQITLARVALVGADGKLNLDRFPYVGLVKTHAADDIVTDSAASGTALATGQKTDNGKVSVSSDGQPIKTVLELAEEQGKATGLVTTVQIVHATPAVFAAHQSSRASLSEIAVQMLDKNIEVLFGGGMNYFIPETELGGKRSDTVNLLQDAEKKGYSLISTKLQLSTATSGRILGLFAGEAFIGAEQEPSLANMVERAIFILSRFPKGFFLMAEGGQIDWKAHGNDQDGLIKEMQDFDTAVGKALEFAKSRKDTLVIVTADHDTGGLSVLSDKDKGLKSSWATKSHTGNMVAVFAYGPAAERFTGVLDNTDIGKNIREIIKERTN